MAGIAKSWHYPRPRLALQYYQTLFDVGLISALALHGKRRMGKTEFLQQDLMPLVREHGVIPIYANFWEARSDPGKTLVHAIASELNDKGLLQMLKLTPRLSASLGGVSAGVDMEYRKHGTSSLDEAFDRLDAGKTQRYLMLFDEAQVLAELAHQELQAALRSKLDTRKERIKVIMVGSSLERLSRMLRTEDQPFYRWANMQDFPMLDDDFVRYELSILHAISRHRLDEASAQDIFRQFDCLPEPFRVFLDKFLTSVNGDAATALQAAHDEMAVDDHFEERWEAFKPADQQLLRYLAAGGQELTSAATRELIGHSLGRSSPESVATIQNAIKRLKEADVVVSIARGRYEFQDSEFLHWLLREKGRLD